MLATRATRSMHRGAGLRVRTAARFAARLVHRTAEKIAGSSASGAAEHRERNEREKREASPLTEPSDHAFAGALHRRAILDRALVTRNVVSARSIPHRRSISFATPPDMRIRTRRTASSTAGMRANAPPVFS